MGVRWWNVRHPAAYAERLAAGVSPAQAREVLDDETRRVERILLETRLVEGLAVDVLDDEGRSWLPDLVANGLVEPLTGARVGPFAGDSRREASGPSTDDRVVLTLKGRMLADAVVRDLVP